MAVITVGIRGGPQLWITCRLIWSPSRLWRGISSVNFFGDKSQLRSGCIRSASRARRFRVLLFAMVISLWCFITTVDFRSLLPGQGFTLELYSCKMMTNKVITPILIDFDTVREVDRITQFFRRKLPPFAACISRISKQQLSHFVIAEYWPRWSSTWACVRSLGFRIPIVNRERSWVYCNTFVYMFPENHCRLSNSQATIISRMEVTQLCRAW